MTNTRRGFLGMLAASAAAMTLDPEKLLWIPGATTISIPSPPFLAVGDIVTFGGYPERYTVTAEARSLARIEDARFSLMGVPKLWSDHVPAWGYMPSHGLTTRENYPPKSVTPTPNALLSSPMRVFAPR